MHATMKRYFRYIGLLVSAAMMLGGQISMPQASAAASPAGFAPLQQWKNAVIEGDAVALKALYSTDPAAKVRANGVVTGADADIVSG